MKSFRRVTMRGSHCHYYPSLSSTTTTKFLTAMYATSAIAFSPSHQLTRSTMAFPLLPVAITHNRILPWPTTTTSISSLRRRLHSHSSVHLTDDEILRVTRDWFDRIVVGWNLCPFANRPSTRLGAGAQPAVAGRSEETFKLEIIRGSNEHDIISFVLGECIVRTENPGTTLVVAPECHPDNFEEYLSYCATFDEDMLPIHGLEDDIQIAPFHPLFQFADSEGVDVWTNRSPYPIFHILREQEVSVAVEKLDGDASKVWKRNIRLLKDLEESLGSEAELEKVIRNADHGHNEEIRGALQRNKFTVDPSGVD
ncbi:Protein of unknown function (DUF1415) [Fragilaria crotonensis]|nr:Protein of unknown function (DUF1415) [Fragilaria crotonensis]